MKTYPLMIMAVAILTLFLFCQKEPQAEPIQTDAAVAPAFALTGIDGQFFQLADYKGKVIILDFWDTWCPPCKKEIPDFIDLQDSYGSDGFVIIGVAFGREGEEKVKRFADENGINYPVALANSEIMDAYGPIQSIPTTFLLDQEGRIQKKYIGFREKAVFEKDILELLSK